MLRPLPVSLLMEAAAVAAAVDAVGSGMAVLTGVTASAGARRGRLRVGTAAGRLGYTRMRSSAATYTKHRDELPGEVAREPA